jgi:two-component system sensor histidine kinase/response regulator
MPAQPHLIHADGLERLKADFLAGLNHEIRTPLSSIIGLTDLLVETDLTAEQRDYVSSARVCAENLLDVLNTTLECAALTAGTLVLDEHEFRLAEAVELAVAQHLTTARQKGLTLLCSYDDSLPATVIGDARRLGRSSHT